MYLPSNFSIPDGFHVVWLLPIVGCIFLIFHLVHSAKNDPLRGIPGPFYVRFSDFFLRYTLVTGRKMHWIQELHAKYGPVVRLGPSTISLGDPDDAKAMTKPSFGLRKSRFYLQMPPGIIDEIDPKEHARKRRLFGHAMSKTGISRFEPALVAKVQTAMECIRARAEKQGGEVNLLEWFVYLAADVVSELSFGSSFRMVEQGKMSQYFKDVQNMMGEVVLAANFPWIARLNTLVHGSAVKGSNPDGLGSFARQSLSQYMEELKTHGEQRPTFFSKVMLSQDMQGLSLEDVQGLGQELVFAGTDTTSTTMSYLVWEVMRNPSIRERLDVELATLPVGYQDRDLEALPYLSALVHETLRLYSAAEGPLPRELAPDMAGHSTHGYYIPQGTEIIFQSHTLHRSAKVFENPDQFIPERWLNPTQAMLETNWAWGHGNRVCLGMHLAYMEIRLTVAAFFKHFPRARLSTRHSDHDMVVENFLVNSPKGKKLLVELL